MSPGTIAGVRISSLRLAAAAASLALVGTIYATDLTLTGLADDFFTASVSTNPNAAGTVFLDQINTWQSGPVSASITLTPGVTNYLNIAARDVFGAPSMFIGQAGLSDTLFSFADASQFIVTDDSINWTASLSGFGGAAVTINDIGGNGSGPWGFHNLIDPSANRIWTAGPVPDVRYYQAVITPVPEPAGLVLAGLAGAAAWLRSKRRTQSKAH